MAFSYTLKRELKPDYTNYLVRDFYDPVLKESKAYKRVVGYFSSSGLDLYVEGLDKLIENDGHLKLIVSRKISKEDYDSIKKGYDLFERLEPFNLEDKKEILSTEVERELGNLAFLIAIGRANVKIGFSHSGAFHDKFGLLQNNGETIMFAGSANETLSGMELNYESIVVDVSWDESERVRSRIVSYENRFNRLWNNIEAETTVVDATKIAYEQLAIFQSQVQKNALALKEDNIENLDDNSIYFKFINNNIVRIDNSLEMLTKSDRKLNHRSDLSMFFLDDNSTIKAGTSYKNIERIISVTKNRAQRKNIQVFISDKVKEFIAMSKYSIEQYQIIGDIYKKELNHFPVNKVEDYYNFCNVVQAEVNRPLYELHLRAAFYEYEMARAANFSVPGAGKTAMILGVFAYLNRDSAPHNEKIDKLLVVSPISAFESWKDEFKLVFGEKKTLSYIDSQSSHDFHHDLSLRWNISNLILINYESLPKHEDILTRLIDSSTMLIFDEVHRVKNPQGVRAKSALNISRRPQFKYVLTGTPIPNSYRDIYNFLHILYPDEYSSFFGWDLTLLDNPRFRQIKEINTKLYPFFWRTNKYDLNIPQADPDILIIKSASNKQLELAEAIYKNEKTSFAKLIRLIQASTNPALLNQKINYKELMYYDEEGDVIGISEEEFNFYLGSDPQYKGKPTYADFDLESMTTPKFEAGISLVEQLVSENKKVLVWGVFVGTLKKITNTLQKKGIKTNLIYGDTEVSDRVKKLNEFRHGDIEVLVSNPQTLGEAISLHREVHDAIYFEYNFNLTFMLQSRDRIHRLGLMDGQYTRYYYVQTKDEDITSVRPGFIDQSIYTRLKEKEKLLYDAVDSKNLSIEYGENEIEEAIKIIDDERLRIRRTFK